MKTMFVAPDNTKKRFQKPNILRRRPKLPPKPSIPVAQESQNVKNLVTTSIIQEPKLQFEKITVYKQCPNKNSQPVQRLIFDNNVDNIVSSIGELYQIDGNVETDRSLAVTCEVLTNNNDEDVFETPINVESFINNSDMEQLVSQADIENELSNRMKHESWCFDFINDAHEIIIEDIDGSHLGSLRLASSAPVSASPSGVTLSPQQTRISTAPAQNITLEYMNCTTNYKCDVPNCSKRFRSEEALKKHKSGHSKGAKPSNKLDKPVSIECPVKKLTSDGVEESCGVYCSSKKEIINHLNEAHNPEDAMYICSKCNRRFYWAAGLRAHSRTHARSAGGAGGVGGAGGAEPWPCDWPGCGRAFRQLCRLREHMRAHTGDKPYPCQYPNCGWSFRTASKLVRHARRHTGERRHECGECGRAFRRREHLRDHAARHHAAKRAAASTGCQKKFNTAEALKNHMERVHNEEQVVVTSSVSVEADMPSIVELNPDPRPEETFLVSLPSPALSTDTLAEVEAASVPTETVAGLGPGAGSPRAARTHCSWPFHARPHSPHVFEENANHEYVLEEDVQVEMSEGSESNIYTIKSDLFLHGNVLNNEDSEQMCSAGVVGVTTGADLEESGPDEPHHLRAGGGAGGAGGAGGEGGVGGAGGAEGASLSLLDAHPTIDLMQEELMYTDAAVDESSFRVFLLSGEDLS